MNGLLIFAAAGAGSVVRYVIGALLAPRSHGFPWATLLINLTGALGAGVVAGAGVPAMAAISVGFFAGYTTFGTASNEAVSLFARGAWVRGAGYAGGTLLGSVALALVGLVIGGAVFAH